VTGDEDLGLHIDPTVPPGSAYVYRRGTGGALENVVPARFALVHADEVKTLPDDVGEQWAKLASQARKPGLVADPLRLTLPLQQSTLDMFTEAAGKAATQMRLFADILGAASGRARRRKVRPVPPIVPPGLSRVDSARARSTRSALLRSRRRAIRHNRALPRPRARIRITATDPKITWGDPKGRPDDRRNDRLDAALYAFTATSRKD
jgi:hypothetical protein